MQHNKLFIALALSISLSSATSHAAPINWESWTTKVAFGISLAVGAYVGEKLGRWLRSKTTTPTSNPTVTYKTGDMVAMVSADMSNSPIAIELANAHYSQNKIREMRERFQQNDPIKLDILNYVLISWYVDQIANAIISVPINKRDRWLDDFGSILIVGIPAFKAGREGPALRYTDDGSETGLGGTKHKAKLLVKERVADIPFKANPQLPNGPDVIEFAQSL